jgi:hypothetical protein
MQDLVLGEAKELGCIGCLSKEFEKKKTFSLFLTSKGPIAQVFHAQAKTPENS